jgi:hypothetical protein
MLKHVWRHVDIENLSDTHKDALTKRLQQRKRELEEALDAVNHGLKTLSARRKGVKKGKKT